MPFHTEIHSREKKMISPGIEARTFWGEKMLVAVVDLEAGSVLPTHQHHHEQISYILEGELEFDLEGETQMVRAGDIVVIPSNMAHTVKVGEKPAKVLDMFNPVREDLK
jgi:quercetin dioxygenase-like cupin family protein